MMSVSVTDEEAACALADKGGSEKAASEFVSVEKRAAKPQQESKNE